MDVLKEFTVKTPYEWCLEYKVRPFNPERWTDAVAGVVELDANTNFHIEMINEPTFLKRLGEIKHKTNSTPRKMPEFLEYKMYGMVIYQLHGIQKGIQYQHAVTEYQRATVSAEDEEEYIRWADDHKTSILLCGGTTNNNPERLGSINLHYQALLDNNVRVIPFYEPDLNDALTSIAFLADERVFEKVLYPSFEPTPKPWGVDYIPNDKSVQNWMDENEANYNKWVEKLGGKGNTFLREFLNGKKLAT